MSKPVKILESPNLTQLGVLRDEGLVTVGRLGVLVALVPIARRVNVFAPLRGVLNRLVLLPFVMVACFNPLENFHVPLEIALISVHTEFRVTDRVFHSKRR